MLGGILNHKAAGHPGQSSASQSAARDTTDTLGQIRH